MGGCDSDELSVVENMFSNSGFNFSYTPQSHEDFVPLPKQIKHLAL